VKQNPKQRKPAEATVTSAEWPFQLQALGVPIGPAHDGLYEKGWFDLGKL
jgi:hypothetical protein